MISRRLKQKLCTAKIQKHEQNRAERSRAQNEAKQHHRIKSVEPAKGSGGLKERGGPDAQV
jgi:hypothetical protein